MPASTSFSIALCTYNGARFLREQLDSIARQDHLPAELVVCDDGSTDGSVAIVEAFASEVPFPVRLRRNAHNLGYAANFRQALGTCTHELIALCDQDDRWRPDKLRVLAACFERGGDAVGGVFSDGALMDAAGQTRPGTLWNSFRFGNRPQRRWAHGQALEELVQRNVVTGMAFAIRKRWVCLMENMPAGWHHDAWLALRLADQTGLLPCPELLVTYRLHEKQEVGVPGTAVEKRRHLRTHGLGSYLRQMRERNLRDYVAERERFHGLLKLMDEGQVNASDRLYALAQHKASYAARGIRLLATSRWRRWPEVLVHAVAYSRFSPTGWPACVRDLLL